jgi:RpiR family transcriptional regulator, carbohydrate utilization regulator
MTMPGAPPQLGQASSVLARVETLAPELRDAERKVAQHLVENAAKVVHLSITELADEAGASEATIIRLARRLGYQGYAAMKIALAMELHRTDRAAPGELSAVADLPSIKRSVIEASIGSLQDTLGLLDDALLEQAVAALTAAGRIEVYGVGESASIAAHAYATLMTVGLPIVAVTDPHLQVTSAVQLRAGDVALAISLTGSSRDTVEAVQFARDAGATCICITRHARSPVARVAHIVLLASARSKSVEGYQLLDRVAQLAVIEMLRVGIALRHEKVRIDAMIRSRKAVTSAKHF